MERRSFHRRRLLQFFENVGQLGIAFLEAAHGVHDLGAGVLLADFADLGSEVLQFLGMGGIVIHHVFDQGKQLVLGLSIMGMAVAVIMMVMMAVIVAMRVLMIMLMGMSVGMLMIVLVVVIMAVGMVMGVIVVCAVGMGMGVGVFMYVRMVMIVMFVFVMHGSFLLNQI